MDENNRAARSTIRDEDIEESSRQTDAAKTKADDVLARLDNHLARMATALERIAGRTPPQAWEAQLRDPSER